MSVYKGIEALQQGDYLYLPRAHNNEACYRLMLKKDSSEAQVIYNVDAPPEFRTHLLLEGYTNV